MGESYACKPFTDPMMCAGGRTVIHRVVDVSRGC